MDTTEFDEFAAAAWPRLRRSAYLLTGEVQLAEDLAQTVLVRAFASWGRVRRGDAFGYCRTILVNLNVDRHRRRQRRVVEVGLEGAADAAVAGVDPGHAQVDDRDEVVRALAALTDRERRVVVLRHYFDLPEAEVADELGVAVGTVKSTNARALAKLRVGVTTPSPR